jgi:FkbH-like protein
VLIFHRLETAVPRLAFDYAGLSATDLKDEMLRVGTAVAQIVAGVRRQTGAMILWQAFEQPLYPALGVLDGQQRGEGQSGTIQALNDAIAQALASTRNAYLVDLNRCIARIGGKDFYDARYWHAAKAPYALAGVREIAVENIKYIRALKGRARKCLVLDCDGVLWGGTIGEDGMSGIQIGASFPGSAFLEFQQEVLNLAHRGVLIALCSKNNADDVWEVFEKHPDMILRRHDVAAARINWTDKAANLNEIARELNIGLDSLVMMDDSQFEVDLIRQFVPEVTSVALPAGRPSEYRGILASCGLFDTLTLSAEDRARGAAYQAETARRQLQSETGDMASFLRSLEMMLEIREADNFALPRVAQLTQKTNQFNLTTQRYSEEDVRRFRDREDADVVYLRYRDRFGDAGIVGVCILRYERDAALIDSLMLSCRVLGREVEGAFLRFCLARAARRGAVRAVGIYRPTAKNMQVKDFYLRQGFVRSDSDSSGDRFECDLTQETEAPTELFRIETDLVPAGRPLAG